MAINVRRVPCPIDFFTFKEPSGNYIKVDDCSDLTLDHTPVVLAINKALIEKKAPPRFTSCKIDYDGLELRLKASSRFSCFFNHLSNARRKSTCLLKEQAA